MPSVYLDECGVDHRLYREYARAPRVDHAVSGARRHRTRIIAASQRQELIAPFVWDGHCTRAVGDLCFQHALRPVRPPDSVIILDKARIHHSPTTLRLVEAAGGHLLFLPAYSPDLKPIEPRWATRKTCLRNKLSAAADPFLFIATMCLCYC